MSVSQLLKKNPKNESFSLSDLQPKNLAGEQAKWEFDPLYNPQFVYETPVGDLQERYGELSYVFQTLANGCIEASGGLPDWGTVYLSKEEIRAQAERYISDALLTNRAKIELSRNLVKRTFVKGTTVYFDSLPNRYPATQFPSLLAHEIGTHVLRRVNHQSQPWHLKPSVLPNRLPYIETEEGLAVLQGMIAEPKMLQYPVDQAINYLGVIWAHEMSFSALAKQMRRWYSEPSLLWKRVLPLKRGLTDTSQPGGPAKQQIYLAGLVKVVNWIVHHPNDYWKLWLGKLAIEDLDRALEVPGVQTDVLLPVEYRENPDKYLAQVFQIAERLYALDPHLKKSLKGRS